MRDPEGIDRMTRVNKLLHQVLAQLLRARWGHETVAITLTGVDCAPDLYDAKILYSVLTDDKASAVSFFRKNKGAVSKALAKEVTLKRMPRLHFVYDPTLKNAANVERILNEMDTKALPPVRIKPKRKARS